LNNVDYGAWEGMTAEEAAMFDPEAFTLYRTSPSRAACPLGERLSDAQHRMMAALQLIGARHGGEAVVAVTHAVMIRLAFVQISGISDETWRRPVGRGSVTAFYAEGGTIWPVPPEQRDTVAEGSALQPAAQPGDWARGEKALG
jgi:broad specificity phosphatase PhoE